jgi:hypothetical protein
MVTSYLVSTVVFGWGEWGGAAALPPHVTKACAPRGVATIVEHEHGDTSLLAMTGARGYMERGSVYGKRTPDLDVARHEEHW